MFLLTLFCSCFNLFHQSITITQRSNTHDVGGQPGENPYLGENPVNNSSFNSFTRWSMTPWPRHKLPPITRSTLPFFCRWWPSSNNFDLALWSCNNKISTSQITELRPSSRNSTCSIIYNFNPSNGLVTSHMWERGNPKFWFFFSNKSPSISSAISYYFASLSWISNLWVDAPNEFNFTVFIASFGVWITLM